MQRWWDRFRRLPGWAQALACVMVGALVWVAIAAMPEDSTAETAGPTTTEPETTTTRERIGSTTTTESPGLGAIPDPDAPVAGFDTAPSLAGGLSLAGAAVFDPDQLLADLDVAPESSADGYERSLFDPGSCAVRAVVLLAESLRPAQRSGCAVTGGAWLSIYDDYRTDDAGELQVDHLVALHEAWQSGADQWSPARRVAFATDFGHPGALVAVTSAVNQSKSDQDPASWQPPNRSIWCLYATDWVTVKQRWSLSVDAAELRALRSMLMGCGAAPAPTTTAAPPPTTIAPAPIVPPTTSGACDPSYPDHCIPPAPPDLDCGDIPYGRFRVLPPDPHGFDGSDDDGWGCESS